MRGLTRALVCFGSLAALSSPAVAAPAQAAPADVKSAETASAVCRVFAARPIATENLITAAVSRAGCRDKTIIDIQLREVRFGKVDRILRKSSRVVRNGRVTISTRCRDEPRFYYVVALDREGNFSRSGKVKLSCAQPTPTKTQEQTQQRQFSQNNNRNTNQNNTNQNADQTNNGGAVGTAQENEVVRLTNQARAREGCRPLTHDPKLRAAAFGHSTDMARNNFFSHNSRDGRDPGDRIAAAGFSPIRSWGENIAAGQRTPAEVVQAWLDSPGHRANIMNCGFTHIGVGLALDGSRPFWTQNFASH